jgi:predicted RNA-binding Zn ribbon-like protein
MLVPIGESAATLLCSSDFSRVKECSNSGCGAFFYDTSKNRGVDGARRPVAGTACESRRSTSGNAGTAERKGAGGS